MEKEIELKEWKGVKVGDVFWHSDRNVIENFYFKKFKVKDLIYKVTVNRIYSIKSYGDDLYTFEVTYSDCAFPYAKNTDIHRYRCLDNLDYFKYSTEREALSYALADLKRFVFEQSLEFLQKEKRYQTAKKNLSVIIEKLTEINYCLTDYYEQNKFSMDEELYANKLKDETKMEKLLHLFDKKHGVQNEHTEN